MYHINNNVFSCVLKVVSIFALMNLTLTALNLNKIQ